MLFFIRWGAFEEASVDIVVTEVCKTMSHSSGWLTFIFKIKKKDWNRWVCRNLRLKLGSCT